MVEDTENEWIRIGLKEELKPNTDYFLNTEYIGFLKASGYIINQLLAHYGRCPSVVAWLNVYLTNSQ